ncbi:MAG: type II toxin-antitoxin system RelE/ParE family toxin [Rhizomicrobium sp.]
MVIWAPRAILDLREAWDYIAADSEAAADRVVARLQSAGEGLDRFPRIGRKGRRSDTRELVVTGTPYILEYRVGRSRIEITRVIHGARKWPPDRHRSA